MTVCGSRTDPLFFNTAPAVPVPHSRSNDLCERDLVVKGYRVLSRLNFKDGSQPDIFTREPRGHSRFVFFRAIPNMIPARWGGNICATWAASCKAKRSGLLGRKIISTAPPKASWPRFPMAPISRNISRSWPAALPRQLWRANTVRLFGTGCPWWPRPRPAAPPRAPCTPAAARPYFSARRQSNRGARLRIAKRHRAMPHVGGKQHQPSGPGLDARRMGSFRGTAKAGSPNLSQPWRLLLVFDR